MSIFSKLADIDAGITKLQADLDSGEWLRRYGELLQYSQLELGYRLLVTEG